MLKNTIRWRREFNIDDLIIDHSQLENELWDVIYVHGHDKMGHPVCYSVYEEFQNDEVYAEDEYKRVSFERRIIQVLEKEIRKLDFSAAGVSTTFLMVFYLKNSPGRGKRDFWIAFNELHHLLHNNYPEFIDKQVFICVSRWYLGFNSVIRPFLSDCTRSKFVFAGPSKTVDTLLNYISPENLPIEYDGLNRRYPPPEFTSDEAATEIEIKPLSEQTVEFSLEEKCSVLGAKGSGVGSGFSCRILSRLCVCIRCNLTQEKEYDAQ